MQCAIDCINQIAKKMCGIVLLNNALKYPVERVRSFFSTQIPYVGMRTTNETNTDLLPSCN